MNTLRVTTFAFFNIRIPFSISSFVCLVSRHSLGDEASGKIKSVTDTSAVYASLIDGGSSNSQCSGMLPLRVWTTDCRASSRRDTTVRKIVGRESCRSCSLRVEHVTFPRSQSFFPRYGSILPTSYIDSIDGISDSITGKTCVHLLYVFAETYVRCPDFFWLERNPGLRKKIGTTHPNISRNF